VGRGQSGARSAAKATAYLDRQERLVRRRGERNLERIMEAFVGTGEIPSLHDLIGREDGMITWWQMSIRGVLVFVYGLLLVRLAGRRVFGKLTVFDIVLAVLVGPNLSRTLTASAPFVPTLAATAVIALAHWSITFLALHSKFVGRLVKGEVVPLVRDGEVDWRAMRRHGLSEGDLEEAARNAGVFELDQIRTAVIERSGRISVRSR
jgi:uncharacterized membrane protein YcaP (DUF421 family)